MSAFSDPSASWGVEQALNGKLVYMVEENLNPPKRLQDQQNVEEIVSTFQLILIIYFTELQNVSNFLT